MPYEVESSIDRPPERACLSAKYARKMYPEPSTIVSRTTREVYSGCRRLHGSCTVPPKRGADLRKAIIVVVALVIAFGIWAAKSYNDLVKLDQAVKSQWAQVENAYQ